jgi:hypothetical protein
MAFQKWPAVTGKQTDICAITYQFYREQVMSKNCTLCGVELKKFLNTPTLDQGVLKDGEQVCSKCFQELVTKIRGFKAKNYSKAKIQNALQIKIDTPSRLYPVSRGPCGEREIKDILLQDEAVLQELRNCISQRGLICEQAELVTGKSNGTSVLLMSNGNLGLIPSQNEIKTKVWNPFVVKPSNHRSLYYVGKVSVLSVSKYQKSVESQTFNMQTIKISYNVDVNKSFQFLSLILAIIVLIGIVKISGEAYHLEGTGILGVIVIAIVTTILYQVIKLIRNIKTAKKKSIINGIAQLIDDAVKAFEIKEGVILKNR